MKNFLFRKTHQESTSNRASNTNIDNNEQLEIEAVLSHDTILEVRPKEGNGKLAMGAMDGSFREPPNSLSKEIGILTSGNIQAKKDLMALMDDTQDIQRDIQNQLKDLSKGGASSDMTLLLHVIEP